MRNTELEKQVKENSIVLHRALRTEKQLACMMHPGHCDGHIQSDTSVDGWEGPPGSPEKGMIKLDQMEEQEITRQRMRTVDDVT